jgi:hypothetical protein
MPANTRKGGGAAGTGLTNRQELLLAHQASAPHTGSAGSAGTPAARTPLPTHTHTYKHSLQLVQPHTCWAPRSSRPRTTAGRGRRPWSDPGWCASCRAACSRRTRCRQPAAGTAATYRGGQGAAIAGAQPGSEGGGGAGCPRGGEERGGGGRGEPAMPRLPSRGTPTNTRTPA